MPLLEAVIFISLWAYGLGQLKLEQPEISISRERDENVHIPCKVSSNSFISDYIYWYQQKPDQSIEYLIQVASTDTVIGKNNKLMASKYSQTSTSTLTINFLEKEDEAVYFCACWTEGTQLIVIPSDRSYGPEFYPKPTIFRPSVAEINLHKAGTHLCLLEKFFPDVIKVYWKEKNGNTILESQQGNTTKTGDTYMKFSWLTVSEESMNKEHRCIVKHEHNKVDQEILFPAIKKEAAINHTIEVYLEDKSDVFQLQLINASAYYTYLLLLLKSLVYFAVISFCLVRRTAVCDHGKSS
ncbi:TCR gamma alternate reading frame protein [Eptesicus fuscus]|uniref:TCR gamma alternate reading frame protein n=1 Tax=Eptesicus fuscus TaxID=29078 RepID=UPI00240403EF|nr:TCR gamma alternate reading frame protein [Eptesicus fuscus]